jgi:transcriptional regulator with XRE-family HTH domain
MTLGDKIRYARKSRGLSQGQLAEKMCVSRSAIAKWETGKGMPDIENLKMLSRLLCVSVDSLLDDSTDEASPMIREPIRLSAYGRGCKKVKKDRLMREKFPDAIICSLLGRPELEQKAHIVDSTLGFLTPAPFGAPEFVKSVRDLDRDFYLVERESDQFFVTVTDDALELRPMPHKQTEKTFRLGSWTFIRCDYLTEE